MACLLSHLSAWDLDTNTLQYCITLRVWLLQYCTHEVWLSAHVVTRTELSWGLHSMDVIGCVWYLKFAMKPSSLKDLRSQILNEPSSQPDATMQLANLVKKRAQEGSHPCVCVRVCACICTCAYVCAYTQTSTVLRPHISHGTKQTVQLL